MRRAVKVDEDGSTVVVDKFLPDTSFSDVEDALGETTPRSNVCAAFAERSQVGFPAKERTQVHCVQLQDGPG